MHHLTEREITLMAIIVPLFGIFVSAFVADSVSHKRKRIEIKRIAYAELLTSIEDITDVVENHVTSKDAIPKAYSAMNNALAMMDLIAPKKIHEKATKAFEIAELGRDSKVATEKEARTNYLNELTSLMRKDLGYESDDVIQERSAK